MVYRQPAVMRDAAELQDGRYDTAIVGDQSAQDAHASQGWHTTPDAARSAAVIPPIDTVSPPTRDELMQKATELGIQVDGRIGDKKLQALIEAHITSMD